MHIKSNEMIWVVNFQFLNILLYYDCMINEYIKSEFTIYNHSCNRGLSVRGRNIRLKVSSILIYRSALAMHLREVISSDRPYSQ